MKISEVAAATTISPKTIRYYEEIGLLPEPPRDTNGYRNYPESTIDTLIFVCRCRKLSIGLEKIKQLVLVQQEPEASCNAIDTVIAEQLQHVRKTLRELKALEAALAALDSSCNSMKVQDCSILSQLTEQNS